MIKSNTLCTKARIAVVFILGLMILTMSFVFGMSCKDGEATTTTTTPPLAITGLIAIDAHDGKIDLTWIPSDAEDFAYYAIYASEIEITDVTGLSPIGQINDRADVTYQITRYRVSGLMLALMDDTEYWFAVTAVDVAGSESKVVTSVSATPTKIEVTPPGLIPTVFNIEMNVGFRPPKVTVPIGTTVVWTNLDGDLHTVTSDKGLFDSGYLALGDTFSYTFTQAGVFYYQCKPHFWEEGTIRVVE